MEKKKIQKEKSGEISRREFLKDAGLVVGGAAIGSTILLAACGGEGETVTATKTVTTTAPGGTATVTTTAAATTVTETVSKFVCPIDGMEFDTLSELQAHFEVAHPEAPPVVLGVLELTVNGEVHYVQVEPNWTLQFLLHDKLGLISVKDWCDRGACGSCTVNMDGRPVLTCMMLAIECNGATIETAEGIATANHPLVEAYGKHHCMQCGYCTPGFLVTAKVLLDRNPNPTEGEIKNFLAGNLCRCSTYPAHPIAILEAAKEL